MYVALPALALKSFLIDINTENIWESVAIAIIGLIFYTSLTFGSKYFFLKTTKSKQDILAMSVAFSSAVYFGVMIIKAIYSQKQQVIDLYSFLFLIGFWIFMYSAAANIMMKKQFKNYYWIKRKNDEIFLKFLKILLLLQLLLEYFYDYFN